MDRHTLAAWGVHLYTSLGLVAAAGAAVCIVEGGDGALRTAFLFFAAAFLIDATDGWLARRARVGTRVPSVDGARLDDLIDFQTYTALPLLLVWRAGLLPEGWAPLLLLPLLASAYGFAQTRAKTMDGFFLGFPSYWNVFAFYVFFLALPAWPVVAGMALLSLLTLVPTRYLYPSRRGPLWRTTLALGSAWGAIVFYVLLAAPADPRPLLLASLVFPVYYMAASWYVSTRGRRARVDEPGVATKRPLPERSRAS